MSNSDSSDVKQLTPPARRKKYKTLRHHTLLLIFSWLIAAVLLYSPLANQLEENLGLNILFTLRGPITPPDDILIISIDRQTANQLDLPSQLRKWPRDIYAQLIDALHDKNAKIIGFDVLFREEKNQQNTQQFASALKNAGNVVIFEFLKKDIINLGDGTLITETLVKPLPLLQNSAIASAPFPLPRIPARVSQAWLFKPEIGNKATLPVTLYHLANLDAVIELISIIENHAAADWQSFTGTILHPIVKTNQLSIPTAQVLRRFFSQFPSAKIEVQNRIKSSTQHQKRLAILFNLYTGTHSQYLNYYGPRNSFNRLSVFRVLNDEQLPDLSNKTIFIGFAASNASEDKDDFLTLYGNGKEALIPGVEIAATLYANILQQNTIKPLSIRDTLILYFLWAFFLISFFSMLKPILLIPISLMMSLIYFALTHYSFTTLYLWLPYIVPLIIQTPIIVTALLLLHYKNIRQEKRNIHEAFSYHLPPNIVNQLEKDVSSILNDGQSTFGICLATDAGQYTTLSERTSPVDLYKLMNQYYNAIFEPVRHQDGYVSDVIGDAMLAIWVNPTANTLMYKQSCKAAIDIQISAEKFNTQNPNAAMPTRIGIHCGEILLGHVGAKDHYEYRAVGDIVNTATRLEGLNKVLGTKILISADLYQGHTQISTRPLGNFMLKGKHQAINVHELLGLTTNLNKPLKTKLIQFQQAKLLFDNGNLSQSLKNFTDILSAFESDGPTKFYIDLCNLMLNPDNKIDTPYTYDISTNIIHLKTK